MTSTLHPKIAVRSNQLAEHSNIQTEHVKAVTVTSPKVFLIGGPDVDSRILLMQHLAQDFDMCAIGSSHAILSDFQRAGFGYIHYPLTRDVNPIADLQSIRRLVTIFKQQKPQIVHAFDTKPGVWGCIAARLAGVPIVIGTVTGFGGSLYDGSSLKERIVWHIYRQLQKWASHQSDMTIFQNHEDHEECIASGIAPAVKATVILGSGVQIKRFSPAQLPKDIRVNTRQKFTIRSDEILVTMISRVIRSKGVLEFMHAAQATKLTHPKARFLLVGEIDEESLDHLNDVELAQLRENLIWLGHQSDIPAILAASDIFVLPTMYREGIPRALLEAACMCLPIVTTDSPGCNDVVQDGVNGFLTPVGDADAVTHAVQTLVDQPALRHQYGQASRERIAERFSLSTVASQTSALYEYLLKQKGII